MIQMHCPSCGAEGRIPKEKVNTRLLCKKCLKSFHLTPEGRAISGAPLHEAVAQALQRPGPDELDHIDEEVEHWLHRLQDWARHAIAAGVILTLLIAAWATWRATRPLSLQDQAAAVARALAGGDAAALRGLSLSGTADQVAEWSEAIRPTLSGLAGSTAPLQIDVSRPIQAADGGVREVVASIRSDPSAGRTGFAVHDLAADIRPATSVDVSMVLAGDDWRGWRLDGDRTLEAYRKMKPGPLARTTRR